MNINYRYQTIVFQGNKNQPQLSQAIALFYYFW
jgi:hypothetical protein